MKWGLLLFTAAVARLALLCRGKHRERANLSEQKDGLSFEKVNMLGWFLLLHP